MTKPCPGPRCATRIPHGRALCRFCARREAGIGRAVCGERLRPGDRRPTDALCARTPGHGGNHSSLEAVEQARRMKVGPLSVRRAAA